MDILKNITDMPPPDWAYITAYGRVIHRYRKDGKRHNVAIGNVVLVRPCKTEITYYEKFSLTAPIKVVDPIT